ncbi:MAG: cardiolipin synthase ClsB, partial [Methylibium sp.]|uniref:cardiolipin synthase ClsB n=1 Tax=Methylibium sp. TaxID=2067992 RepID=UPI0017BEF830
MNSRWTDGNRFRLLENGEAFFPAVFAAIEAAEREVLIETFILFEDKVGLALHAALIAAARRGVQVDLTVDGWGSPDLSPAFIEALTAAGVHLHVFDPIWRVLGKRLNVLRRMHRKIVVIDGRLAFVGGINYSADHLADFGPLAKQDYSVECVGPIVDDIHGFACTAVGRPATALPAAPRRWFRRRAPASTAASAVADPPASAGSAQALFVTRDNHRHRTDIERHYRIAIRAARREVTIANAYFFPGYRLLRELRRAARRGVRVRLILQGEPDMPIVKFAAGMLYDNLLRAGVKIFEYCDRPLHGKVAFADDEWATVGSSNLDPLSLSLNLEANVIIRDRGFNRELRERLEHLIDNSCNEVMPDPSRARSFGRVTLGFFVFHFVRRFPGWASALPAHRPTLSSLRPRARNDGQDPPGPAAAPSPAAGRNSEQQAE